MPIFAFDIWPDGRAEPARDMEPAGPGAFRWFHFDLADPDLPDWSRANLPEIPAGALLHAETRPRCDAFNEGLILNLRAINLNPGQQSDMMVSIRMWITARMVVTVRKMRVFTLDDIAGQCRGNRAPGSVAAFLVALVQGLARRVHDTVLELDQTTEELELLYEDSDEATDLSALKDPRRQVIRMLRYLTPQGEALSRLMQTETPVLERTDRIALREPVNLMALSVEELASLKSRLEALQEAGHAAMTARLARNNYVLSLVAAVFLPLGFVAGLFGVNVGGMPGLAHPAAFAILCAGLAMLGALCVLVLKWLRLL
ncbi:MAG: CorA family divalent cation transporter [Jhaorihella sp.]